MELKNTLSGQVFSQIENELQKKSLYHELLSKELIISQTMSNSDIRPGLVERLVIT